MSRAKNPAIGSSYEDFRKQTFTAAEIAETDLKVAIVGELINARANMGISQADLEQLSGVRQPVISRLETGETDPKLNTLIKILTALGLTLKVVPQEEVTSH